VRLGGAAGRDAAIDARIKTRGHWRRQKQNCGLPPVLLRLDSGTKGTVFAKQKRLKLVTPCWLANREFEQYVVQEYLLYRLYNLITPLSFRARLVRVTFEDAKRDKPPVTSWAFFVEDEHDMAARNGGAIVDSKSATRDDLVPQTLAVMTLFEFMIGNTDWSIPALHNVRLVRTDSLGLAHPVPYDFDFSGAVGTRYAQPDPRLPITDVRERLYRGYCMPADSLAAAIALFDARRSAVDSLYRAPMALDPKLATRTRDYFTEFYKTIDDRRALARAIPRHCMR
jgi:hypothetical protein